MSFASGRRVPETVRVLATQQRLAWRRHDATASSLHLFLFSSYSVLLLPPYCVCVFARAFSSLNVVFFTASSNNKNKYVYKAESADNKKRDNTKQTIMQSRNERVMMMNCKSCNERFRIRTTLTKTIYLNKMCSLERDDETQTKLSNRLRNKK